MFVTSKNPSGNNGNRRGGATGPFDILATTKFDPALLVTEVSFRNGNKGTEKQVKISYDGKTNFRFMTILDASTSYKDNTKDLTLQTKATTRGEYGELPHNLAVTVAGEFWQALSEEIIRRYREQKWYVGDGPGGEGGIKGYPEIVVDPVTKEEVSTIVKAEDRFKPLVSADGYGVYLDLQIYNYRGNPKANDNGSAWSNEVQYYNARTMEKVSIDDVVGALAPAYGYYDGINNVVLARGKFAKRDDWYNVATGNRVSCPVDESSLSKCRTSPIYARVETSFFSNCNPGTKMSKFAWTLKFTPRCVEVFVPKRRLVFLRKPFQDVFAFSRPYPFNGNRDDMRTSERAFIPDLSAGWVQVIDDQMERFKASKRGLPSSPSNNSNEADGMELDDQQPAETHEAKKIKV